MWLESSAALGQMYVAGASIDQIYRPPQVQHWEHVTATLCLSSLSVVLTLIRQHSSAVCVGMAWLFVCCNTVQAKSRTTHE